VTAASLRVDTRALVDAGGAGPLTSWPERLSLTFGIVLFVAVVLWAAIRRWRAYDRGHLEIATLPTPPADLGNALAGPFEGRYLATTTGDAREPVVSRGLGRAGDALLAVTDAGVYVERTGAPALFIPAKALVAAHVERPEAGSQLGPGSLVVISWAHGRRRLDSGFRADAPRRHVEVVDAVGRVVARATPRPTSTGTPEGTS
jgi:hypothetical protein